MRRALSIIVLALAALVWVAALIAAPTAASHSHGVRPAASAVIYGVGSLICHQRPERSFHHEGAQLPVCARCFGLYSSGLLGVLAWALIGGLGQEPSARARHLASASFRGPLLLTALPTAISVLTASLGWWDPDNLVRALLAVPLGFVIGAGVCAVAARDLR